MSREFFFGEYETFLFMDPLENVNWKFSVHVTEIVTYIQRFFHNQALDVWSEASPFSNLAFLASENGKRIEAILYQETALWVFKYNCYFAFKLSEEFIKLAQKDTRNLKAMVI